MDASGSLACSPAATLAPAVPLSAGNCSAPWAAPCAASSSPFGSSLFRSLVLSMPAFRWVPELQAPALQAPALAVLPPWLLAMVALAAAALLAILATKALRTMAVWLRRTILLARLPHPPERALIIGDLAAMVLLPYLSYLIQSHSVIHQQCSFIVLARSWAPSLACWLPHPPERLPP